MRTIRLIDVDNQDKPLKYRYPNLALMKISAWHKQLGDIVSWNETDPDIVYASVVFTENKHKLYWLKTTFPNAEIKIGGSGHSFETLPDEIDRIMPDYSLYNTKKSYGFTTRGCPNKCKFCIVDKKEGNIRPYMEIKEFHNPKHKNIVLMDNNILALKDWFRKNMEYVKDHNLKVDFNQGLDIRKIDADIIEILKGINFKELRFAWDSMAVSNIVKKKLDMIEKEFWDLIHIQHRCSFYVLVEFGTNIVQDLERVHYLRNKNIVSYIMPYQQIYPHQPQPTRQRHTKSLERYCNKRNTYYKYDTYWDYLEDYYSLPYQLKILHEYKKAGGRIGEGIDKQSRTKSL